MQTIPILIALLFALMGMAALVSPAFLARSVDSEASSPNFRNEIRAVYGGFGVALALLLAWVSLSHSGFAEQMAEGVYLTVAIALGGMAAGRLVSSLIERPGAKAWLFCGIEFLGAALLVFPLWLERL